MTSESLQLGYRESASMKHGQHMPAQIFRMAAQIRQLRCTRTAGRLWLQGGLLCYAGPAIVLHKACSSCCEEIATMLYNACV